MVAPYVPIPFFHRMCIDGPVLSCRPYLAWRAHYWRPEQANEAYYFETIQLERLLRRLFLSSPDGGVTWRFVSCFRRSI